MSIEAYADHNDAKGRSARRAVAINRDERARQSTPDDITLYMSAAEVWSRLAQGRELWCAGLQSVSEHETNLRFWRCERFVRRAQPWKP